ncbi:MAG TPA: hypothetical protein VIM41_14700 [Gammaproteobacteria bacterium]
MISSFAFALGNHPEAAACSPEKPYQAICTHSLHSLEGWYGQCYATQEEAQQDADKHAAREHSGNSRWTGIKKGNFKGGAGY